MWCKNLSVTDFHLTYAKRSQGAKIPLARGVGILGEQLGKLGAAKPYVSPLNSAQ